MNTVILGPQGSGKGTQAKLLSQKFKLFYFETGELLRNLAKADPKIDEIINKEGKLLPDEETFSLVKRHLEGSVPELDRILFDGYPRSVPQYRLLKDFLSQKGRKLDLAVLLMISDDEAVRRLSARVICEKCGAVYNLLTDPPQGGTCPCGGKLVQRKDDMPEAIRVRLRGYHEVTTPLVEVFRQESILVEVDGERPIAVIQNDLARIFEERTDGQAGNKN